MRSRETITGFIRKFIKTNLLLSEQFIQVKAPLVGTDTTFDKINQCLEKFFIARYSPYQFAYVNLMHDQPTQLDNIKTYKHVIYHPLGLMNFSPKNTANDFDQVDQNSFVHSLDLVNQAWKMDEFELDDVQTVASEYDLDHHDDFEQLSLTSGTESRTSLMTASASF